jgi:FAD/FMN-containing dehydrogenase
MPRGTRVVLARFRNGRAGSLDGVSGEEVTMTDIDANSRLSGSFHGTSWTAGTPEYEDARTVFNGMIDRRPAVIARCADSTDVVSALDLARSRGLDVTVYGGGHAVTGAAVADGAVCIDLRGMKDIEIDVETAVARVGGGCIWRELDAAGQAHGLAVTGGRMSGTGVGGLTLGTGSGWLERMFGYTCDNLLEAEVVTADGRIVSASPRENPELFWALRGGGGNFGIVTRFTLQLHPVGPQVLGGMLLYPAKMSASVLKSWRDFILTAPDEVGGGVGLITAPPLDFVPAALRGQPVIAVIPFYVGDTAEGERALAPLLEYGPPAANLVQPMPYTAMQQLIDAANPKGLSNYWKADFYDSLPDEAVDTLVEIAGKPVSPQTQVIIFAGGGAAARVPEDATAVGIRSSSFNIHYLSMWADPAATEANIAYTRDISAAMKRWAAGHVYLNFIGDEGFSRVAEAFGPEKFRRLRQLKSVWDPDNVFRHNHNIPPL